VSEDSSPSALFNPGRLIKGRHVPSTDCVFRVYSWSGIRPTASAIALVCEIALKLAHDDRSGYMTMIFDVDFSQDLASRRDDYGSAVSLIDFLRRRFYVCLRRF